MTFRLCDLPLWLSGIRGGGCGLLSFCDICLSGFTVSIFSAIAVSLASKRARPRTRLPAPSDRLTSLAPLASGLGWSWAPLAWKNIACSVCLQKCVTGYPQCPRHGKTSRRPPLHIRLGQGLPVGKHIEIHTGWKWQYYEQRDRLADGWPE